MGKKLSMRNITKRYPGVVALDNVSIEIEPGEVHALVGENGAGKSTLIKVLSGAVSNDEGEVQIGERTFSRMTTQLAKENGVAVIYQECSLIPSLSVAENVYLGKKFGKLVNRKQLLEKHRRHLIAWESKSTRTSRLSGSPPRISSW